MVEFQSSSSSSDEDVQHFGEQMDIDFALNYNEPSGQFSSHSSNQMQRARRNIITKLVATLDRCKVSDRDAVHIIIAVSKALNHNISELIIN